VAQFFGIMPLSNILSRDPQDVKFKVRSFGLGVTGLFLLLGGIKTLIGANVLFNAGLNAKNMGEFGKTCLVFYPNLIYKYNSWLGFPYRGHGQLAEFRGIRSVLVAYNVTLELFGYPDAFPSL